jgi:transporter family protein
MLALMATFIFGFWGYFPKLATQYLEPRTALLYQNVGTLLSSVVLFAVL